MFPDQPNDDDAMVDRLSDLRVELSASTENGRQLPGSSPCTNERPCPDQAGTGGHGGGGPGTTRRVQHGLHVSLFRSCLHYEGAVTITRALVPTRGGVMAGINY